ncbi:MAG: DNA polymerase III subunit delta' [Rhodobacteraceae bacterium]|nr:DNA polymerase III subunit delta' [Paracoccaceae bacterium]
MDGNELVEADRVPGALHPRYTSTLLGQAEAERQFLEAYNRRRLHHGWLIVGPRGVGKATLAWRIAKFMRVKSDPAARRNGPPAKSLQVDADHPSIRHLLNLTERSVTLVRRNADPKSGRVESFVSVASVRELKRFFSYSSAHQLPRVAIIDSVDEMNKNALNALLKLLEEPPAGSLLLLVCNSRALVPATIASRCRMVRCLPIAAGDVAKLLCAQLELNQMDAHALAQLSEGSVGEAMRIHHGAGMKIYSQLVTALSRFPDCTHVELAQLALKGEGADGNRFADLLCFLLLALIRRTVRTATGLKPETEVVPGEFETLVHLARAGQNADAWARTFSELSRNSFWARKVNIDNFSTIFGSFDRILHRTGRLAGSGS